jgi:hypothetical protein
MATRRLMAALAVAALSITGNGLASHAAACKPKPAIAKAPRTQEQNVKVRYYGGPKSPMYP